MDSLYIRNFKAGQKAGVDHLAWLVKDTKDESEATLKRLGLTYTDDGPTAWNVKDPDGLVTQICGPGTWPGGP